MGGKFVRSHISKNVFMILHTWPRVSRWEIFFFQILTYSLHWFLVSSVATEKYKASLISNPMWPVFYLGELLLVLVFWDFKMVCLGRGPFPSIALSTLPPFHSGNVLSDLFSIFSVLSQVHLDSECPGLILIVSFHFCFLYFWSYSLNSNF